MDIYGPNCERLLRAALEGPAAGPLQVGRHSFRLRQVEILKAPDGLGLDGGPRRHLSLCRGLLPPRRLPYRCRLAADARMIELAVGDLAIDATLGRWLVAEGSLLRLGAAPGERSWCWPSEAPLSLVDALPGWRGEAAFLLANVLVAASRRHLAPRRAAAGSRAAPLATGRTTRQPAAEAPPSQRPMAGAVHLA